MRSNNFWNGSFKWWMGAVVVFVGANSAFSQTSPYDEYEEWQKAKREELRERREYLKNPKQQNYLDWRSAQRDANREYEEYKLALEVSGGYRNGRAFVIGRLDDASDEYEDLQSARRELVRERREFVSNPTDDNYRGWKEAQADVVREYADYRVAVAPLRTANYIRNTTKRRVPVRRVKVKRTKTCYCR